MSSRIRSRIARVSVLLGVVTAGCTIDDPQVGQIGVVTLFPVNPAIVSQTVTLAPGGTSSGNFTQTAFWEITRADLKIIGAPESHDLAFPLEDTTQDPPCIAVDSSFRSTNTFRNCAEGLVLEALGEDVIQPATLEIDFSVTLKRTPPLFLPFIGDADGDGILNGNDNCVLIDNPGQEDSGGLGIGNACRITDVFGSVSLDSDGDGVSDPFDNCAHVANPFQLDTPDTDFLKLGTTIPDGIGDDCVEERIAFPTETNILVHFDFILPSVAGFVVVDFNDALVFPNCDWANSTCAIDTSMIRVCIRNNSFEASLGCS